MILYLAEQHVFERLESASLFVRRVVGLERLVEVGEGSLEVFLIGRVQNACLQIQSCLNGRYL